MENGDAVVKCLKHYYNLIFLQRQTLNSREGGKWRLEGELREDEKFMLASLHMIKVQFSPRPFQIALASSNTNKVDG